MSRQSELPDRSAAGRFRARPGAPRVFLGLVEIAGYYKALELGLRGIGIEATAVDLTEHRFRYGLASTRPPLVVRLAIRARRRLAAPGGNTIVARTASRAARVLLLVWAIRRFDVFVFASGESFFRRHDLPWLKRLGKRIVVVYHGSDLRPPYMDGPSIGNASGLSIEQCASLAERRKGNVRLLELQADAIVSHPLYSHFLERPYVRYLSVGLPVLDLPAGVTNPEAATRIRVLHSPSDPDAKGSARIRAAAEELAGEGLPIDYVEVSGQPHAVVLDELVKADLVVDQLYSDTPMAGFAAEAASFGRPVIVGSCAWAEIRRAVPRPDSAPVRACAPGEISSAIRELALDPIARRELGERGRAFAVARCAPAEVARRFLRVLEDDIPADWYGNPSDTRHLCGAAAPSERIRSVVHELLTQHGRHALQLADKPDLEAALVGWASGAGDGDGPAVSDCQPDAGHHGR